MEVVGAVIGCSASIRRIRRMLITEFALPVSVIFLLMYSTFLFVLLRHAGDKRNSEVDSSGPKARR